MALAGRTGRGIAVVASGERRAEDADSPLGTALPDAGPFAAWRPLRLFSDVFSLITTLRHSDRAPIVPRGASFLGNKTTPKRAMRRTSQIRHGKRTEHAHFPLIEDGRGARCAGERPDVRSALSSCAAPFTKGRRLRKENAASILRPAGSKRRAFRWRSLAQKKVEHPYEGCSPNSTLVGGAENRTPVHTRSSMRLYKLSRRSAFGGARLADERCAS